MEERERREAWEENAEPYFTEVGRLVVAAAYVETIVSSLIDRLLITPEPGSGVTFEEHVQRHNERIWTIKIKKLGSKPGFKKLWCQLRKLVRKHDPRWQAATRRALKETEDLLEERHIHVHRVLVCRAEGSKVHLSSGDLDSPEPDIDGMRAAANRLRVLGRYLLTVVGHPTVEPASELRDPPSYP